MALRREVNRRLRLATARQEANRLDDVADAPKQDGEAKRARRPQLREYAIPPIGGLSRKLSFSDGMNRAPIGARSRAPPRGGSRETN